MTSFIQFTNKTGTGGFLIPVHGKEDAEAVIEILKDYGYVVSDQTPVEDLYVQEKIDGA